MGLRSNVELETALFVLNATALFVWEIARWRGIVWLSARWPTRLIACATFLAVAILMFEFLSGYPFTDTALPALLPFAPLVYFGFAGIVLFLYSRAISDLFILTIAAFSLVVVITAGLLRFTFNSSSELGGAFSALYIGGAIVVQMAVAFYWLQKVARSKERSQ
jgi:hypothetical protein